MGINKYSLEFMLSARSTSAGEITNSLLNLGDKLEVASCGSDEFRISIQTIDPAIIFDTCAQFGRIKSVKVSETKEGHPSN